MYIHQWATCSILQPVGGIGKVNGLTQTVNWHTGWDAMKAKIIPLELVEVSGHPKKYYSECVCVYKYNTYTHTHTHTDVHTVCVTCMFMWRCMKG